MPLHPTWGDISVRLALTVLAGLLIGLNRTERGRAAGMRTTLLVCLTASLSMILPNLMLDSRGKTGDSFVVLDLMRLPLGVLSGIGFIGAGTILRRNDLILGVTTAATMWFVTMLGMCFGAGQLTLGIVSLCIALAVLWLLKYVELMFQREHTALLTVYFRTQSNDVEPWVREELRTGRYSITAEAMATEERGERRCLRWQLCWQTRQGDGHLPAFLDPLAARQDVTKVAWEPTGLQLEARTS